MGRASLFFLVLLAATGSWFLFNEVSAPRPPANYSGAPNAWSVWSTAGADRHDFLLPPPRSRDVIRIATFHLDHFDRYKSMQADTVQALARIIRNFDIVAVQDIRCLEQHVLPRFVDAINGVTQDFDFVIGPHVGRYPTQEQLAFIFNTQRVALDRSEIYTIQDPDDLLHSEPLVAWFRTRGAKPEEAFTFTLVNIHTHDQDGEAERENRLLRSIFENVRNDRRGEDDIILLGDFQMPTTQLKKLANLPSAVFVIAETPTDPAQLTQRHNIIFDSMATVEFTGRSGVLDFLREMNLSLEQAERISRHLPVWAEFSIFEGTPPRRVADRRKQ